MKQALIGILGGMGPEATASFFHKVIKNTPAKSDQEHFRILIYNNPKIPDRTEAILQRGQSSLNALVESALFLENAGAAFIAIPCVSSHYYFKELQSKINIPILHIIEEALTFIKSEFKHVNNVGLLATTGTIYGGLFQNLSAKFGINIIIPPEDDQNLLMEAIYGKNGVKAGITTGEPREKIIRIADSLMKFGAETIVGGCTEIPLVIKNNDIPIPFIDTLEVLAKATVKKALSLDT